MTSDRSDFALVSKAAKITSGYNAVCAVIGDMCCWRLVWIVALHTLHARPVSLCPCDVDVMWW